MARTLASNLSVEDTVVILANRLSKLIPFTTCAIALFDAARSDIEIVHAVGLDAEKLIKRRLSMSTGITGWVVSNQQAMYNTNPVLDLGFFDSETASRYKSAMVFPLVKNKEPLGAIALYSTEIEGYASEHINLMESICQPASDAVYNAITFEQAQRSALTDPVTGLATLNTFTMQFERERARSQRLGTPLSLIVLSVSCNAEPPGNKAHLEQILASLGKMVKQQMREADLLAQLSISAFVGLLPESGRQEAGQVRSRLLNLLNEAYGHLGVSVSLGYAISPDDGCEFEDLLMVAQAGCGAEGSGLASGLECSPKAPGLASINQSARS
jgi:GGDEF domain-containing protein